MSKVSAVKGPESFHLATGSLRSCVCVTPWPTTKAFLEQQNNTGGKGGGACCRGGGFRSKKRGDLAFESGPAQMYRAGLGCECHVTFTRLELRCGLLWLPASLGRQ